MKLNPWSGGESRRDWIRLGNDTSSETRSVPESKNNRYDASNHRHGGVGGVGMLRRVMKLRGEILKCAYRIYSYEQQASQAYKGKGVLALEEVGEARSSVEALVMRCGAKEPYFGDVNREAKDV